MPAAPKRVFSCVCCWTLIVNCRQEKIPFAPPPPVASCTRKEKTDIWSQAGVFFQTIDANARDCF